MSSMLINETCKRIVRYIHAAGLGAGDHLPATPKLLSQLGVSDRAMGEAMRSLVEAKMVERRRRMGTIVLDPHAKVQDLWQVAVAVNPDSSGDLPSYEAVLSDRLRIHLAINGCVDRTFVQAPGPPIWPGDDPLPRFPGLHEAMKAGQIDAVATTRQMGGLPGQMICHIGSWEGAPWGVELDRAALLDMAFEALRRRGCRRIGLVNFLPWEKVGRRTKRRFEQLMRSSGAEAASTPILSTEADLARSPAIAERLLDMPADQRPQGLVVTSDLVAVGLIQRLARHPDYRPEIAVQSNRQIPLSYALPVIRIAFDIDELARVGVETITARLRNPGLPGGVTWFKPVPVDCADSRVLA